MKNLNFKVPTSLYRLQLNADFPLKKALAILPYLKKLGIEGIYCSPYFKAFSSHGYDITDPNTLNPQIGTMEEYEQFCRKLQELELMHIIDVVPNHMGIKGGQNRWWQDVLENGPHSLFASFFDINWNPDKLELQNKVLLPILGKSYGEVLEEQQIVLTYEKGVFICMYSDYPLPLAPHSYALILEADREALKASLNPAEHSEWEEYQKLIKHFRFFPSDPQERVAKKQEGMEWLHRILERSSKIRKHLMRQVETINGKKGDLSSFEAMEQLLDAQFYRLSYWRVASHEINYRRFFNVNDLVSIRIEDEHVLESHHKWVFKLIDEGHIQGVRIDHPDGLYNPARYFERLRQRFLLYTVVEKILDRKEKLPKRWQVEGTVGYEYLNLLNGLFVQQEHEKAFSSFYTEFTGKSEDFDTLVYHCKKIFTGHEMASEIEALGLRLDRLSEVDPRYRDFTRRDLTDVLAEVIACFPVYRCYIGEIEGVAERDRNFVKAAIEKAKNLATNLDPSIFEFLEKVLLLQLNVHLQEWEGYREFVLKFQQLTAPIMAKGVEDTAFYRYNRFISLNEVGGDPTHFGVSVGSFHAHFQEKKEKWPYTFIATSTHDVKRSEDVRMRLNVLSEMPEKWELEVKKWALVNNKYKEEGVSADTEYMIYQTLLGIWPSEPLKKEDYSLFCTRFAQFLTKALREAKQETNWIVPNTAYEEKVLRFAEAILSPEKSPHFLEHFTSFHQLINRLGAYNSLSLMALKIGLPGVVDLYQGNELLIYQLVDPDNRAPVNFEERIHLLHSQEKVDLARLFAQHALSKLKFYLQAEALQYRSAHKELLLEGEYLPLPVEGEKKDHVIAFMRKKEEQILIVLAARFFATLAPSWDLPLGKQAWGNTEVILPSSLSLTNLFTQESIQGPTLPLATLFSHLPFAYLTL